MFNDANAGFNIPGLGLNTGVTNPSLYGSPDITINGFDEIGLTPHLGRIDTTGHIDETFTYTAGAHQLRFGGEYRRSRLDVFYDRNKRGVFNFDGTVGNWGTGSSSLDSLSDFLAGYVNANRATITYGDLQRDYYLNGASAFLQDSWKVRPNLTLNYGVNWVYQSPISDPTDRISTFIPADGGITYVNKIGTLWPRDWNNFAPRFDFAYTPKFSSKMVIRGGYGIYYQVPNVNYFGDNKPPNHGATGILANPYGQSPVYTLVIQNGVPIFGNADFPVGALGAFSVSRHFITAYSQNSNVNIQYQLNQSSVLEVGYTGSLSRHLPVTLDINQIPLGGGPRPYAASFPSLSTINEIQSVGNGYYNGLIASLRTSNFRGFTTKLNYTYGHSRDDLSATRGLIPQNSYNLRGDYGNSDYDIRHSFAGFLSYAAPAPSRLKLLLGGWQFNSLLTFYTGQPFTVMSGSNTSGTKENNDRASVISDPFKGVPADVPGSYAYWFNPAAFALPATSTYGNQARNKFAGPPVQQVDFSVFKNTKLTGRFNTQLRLEIFNLFNTRVLAPPDKNFGGSGLGQVTQTLDVFNGAPGIGTGAPRNVQLALKLIF